MLIISFYGITKTTATTTKIAPIISTEAIIIKTK
jgi:hypothetical protein